MRDRTFKNMNHAALDYVMNTNGQDIAAGYRPDYSLKKEDQYIILESEVSTSRKGYIGGMLKAAKFLTGNKSGSLVYVFKERSNTKQSSLTKQLREYFEFIGPITNLENVYVIKDSDYAPDGKPLNLFSQEFLMIASSVALAS